MNLFEKHRHCENCPNPRGEDCVGIKIEECHITKEQLKEQIKEILRELYEKDYYLIQNEVNEVCIVAHFWRYFFNKFQTEYDGFDMDTEYNRNGQWAKYYGITERQKKYAKPDMIIHKRGCNYHNFLIIEFKGEWNPEDFRNENDDKKLVAFTSQNILLNYDEKRFSYRYSYGVRIKLYKNSVGFKWFEKGQKIEEYILPGKKDEKGMWDFHEKDEA